MASFSEGGHKASKYTDGEHDYWADGSWGFINSKGEIIIEPIYKGVRNFEGKFAEAWTKDGKHILINKKGETIKVFSKEESN